MTKQHLPKQQKSPARRYKYTYNPPSRTSYLPIRMHFTKPQVVSFTMPYFDLGLRLLVNKLEPTKTTGKSIWQFLEPFSTGLWVWIIVCTAIFAVSVFIIEQRKNEFDFTADSTMGNIGRCCGLGFLTTFSMFNSNSVYRTVKAWWL